MNHKYAIDLFFQLFVYILQQFNQNLLKKQVLKKPCAYEWNHLVKVLRNHFWYKFSESVEKSLGHGHLRPKQLPQFWQKCGNFAKIEVAVLASNGCVPDFFQLILKIYIKNDFLTPQQGNFVHRHIVFIALDFSANFG